MIIVDNKQRRDILQWRYSRRQTETRQVMTWDDGSVQEPFLIYKLFIDLLTETWLSITSGLPFDFPSSDLRSFGSSFDNTSRVFFNTWLSGHPKN